MNLGIFQEFWDGHPNHMPFLGLHDDNDLPSEWNLNLSLKKLDLLCNKHTSRELIEGILTLLMNEDWRPHLVGIIASFKLPSGIQKELIPNFWDRLEKGSWISHQILSVLSIIDNEFELKTKKILTEGFHVNFSRMSAIEHHSARGPENSKDAAEKIMSSIAILSDEENNEVGWKTNLIKLIESNRLKLGKL